MNALDEVYCCCNKTFAAEIAANHSIELNVDIDNGASCFVTHRL